MRFNRITWFMFALGAVALPLTGCETSDDTGDDIEDIVDEAEDDIEDALD